MSIVLGLSGGLDSTTLLAKAKHEKKEIKLAVQFCYGSKHNVHEKIAARNLVQHYNIPICQMEIGDAFSVSESALLMTGDQLPVGHYEDESMRRTVIPGRNLIFASILAGIAESLAAEEVWLGMHRGDALIYPDCRPEWVAAAARTIRVQTEDAVHLVAPLLQYDKVGIVKLAHEFGVPFELTRTCYTTDPVACGKCGSCQERLEAFMKNDLEDPLEYQSRELLAKAAS